MPNFKKYSYSQSAMVVIDFEEQLQPGTFEFTLHKLIDNHIDLSVSTRNIQTIVVVVQPTIQRFFKDNPFCLRQRHHLKPRDPVAM